MESYPSISPSHSAPNQKCHIFVKYDGSNLRFEWSQKKGWYKQGTREYLFDESMPVFGPAVGLFRDKYADDLERLFRTERTLKSQKSILTYCEWFGAKTFTGRHQEDDPKTMVLFDVFAGNKGFLDPPDFCDIFGGLEIAELLDCRVFDDDLIEEVRNGSLDCRSKLPIANEFPEGVVCKGGKGHKRWMAKIKIQAYLDKLKEVYGQDWARHGE